MKLFVITLNVVGWPLIQLTLARVFLLLPDALFAEDSWLTRERWFERGGEVYRQLFRVHQWKDALPDGASWVGGRRKKLASRSTDSLATFAIETRRGEIAHWSMLLCTPVFYLWNPLWACAVMTLYGLATNVPCILVQRANRIKIRRILRRSTSSEAEPAMLPSRQLIASSGNSNVST